MEDYLGIIQNLGFALESGRDGMKILKNRSDLKSMEKALRMLYNASQQRLDSLSDFVNRK